MHKNSDHLTILTQLQSSFNQLRTPDGYIKAAYPGYNRIFGRDSLIVAWQMLPIEPEIARKVLLLLAKYQGTEINKKSESEPGKILHEDSEDFIQKGKFDWEWPYYGSIDSTPLFIILAGYYLNQTNDSKTIKLIWPQITLALKWMSKFGDLDGDGFLEYKRRNPKGLFHQGWKDSIFDSLKIIPPVALVEVQGYAYAAYMQFVFMAEYLHDLSYSSQLANKNAVLLKEKFHSAFWIPDEHFYALAVDGHKNQKKQITSNPGHLIFTGILTDIQINNIIKRLFEPDMLTKFGIRTLSENDSDFDPNSYHRGSIWPHDNWMIYIGLRMHGYKKEAETIKKALFKAYSELHSIPELYAVRKNTTDAYEIMSIKNIVDLLAEPNKIQAWSLGALISMLADESI